MEEDLTRYTKKRSFRWILQVEGIDTFLMKSVKRPTITPRRWLSAKVSDFQAEMYDTVSPSGASQVMEWSQDPTLRTAELKLLDEVGTVLEKWSFDGVSLKKAEFSKLDYVSNDAASIMLTLGCKHLLNFQGPPPVPSTDDLRYLPKR